MNTIQAAIAEIVAEAVDAERAAWVAMVAELAAAHEAVMDARVPMSDREERESGRRLVRHLRNRTP